jgi:CHAT domain-containing protein
VLALGDPIFGSDDDRWPGGFVSPRGPRTDLDFQRLPHTEDEVRTIGDLYGQDSTLLLGVEATREELKARGDRFRILHLATHARGDRRIPERSRLALSCVDASGAVLEICDLYLDSVTELELCGQTVVLSACSTAIGPGLAGEGTLGLPRAFLEAGATAVVASLWDVDDKRTAQLMKLFHQRLLEGHGTAEALGLAQSELARSGMSVRTWGAFVVIGDG